MRSKIDVYRGPSVKSNWPCQQHVSIFTLKSHESDRIYIYGRRRWVKLVCLCVVAAAQPIVDDWPCMCCWYICVLWDWERALVFLRGVGLVVEWLISAILNKWYDDDDDPIPSSIYVIFTALFLGAFVFVMKWLFKLEEREDDTARIQSGT